MTQRLKPLKWNCKPLCVHKGIRVLYLYPLAFSYVPEKYSSFLEEEGVLTALIQSSLVTYYL